MIRNSINFMKTFKKIESQINFMHLSGSTKIKGLQFEIKISGNFKTIIFSCSIKKGII